MLIQMPGSLASHDDRTNDLLQAVKTLGNLIDKHGAAERLTWLEAMINHVPDYIYAKDTEGRFLFANNAVLFNNGFESIDNMLGLTDADIHGPDLAEAISEVERQVITTGRPDLGYEERAIRGGGPDKWLMMSRVPLRDRSGQIIGVVGASRDISDRKTVERVTKAHAALLERVLERVPTARLLAQLPELIESLSGGLEAAVLNASDRSLYLSKGEASSWSALTSLASEQGCFDGQIVKTLVEEYQGLNIVDVRTDNGEIHALVAVKSTLDIEHAEMKEFCRTAARLVGIAIDREKSEQRMRALATTDALTGLPNRSAIIGYLNGLIDDGAPKVGVAFIDLDDFKYVNDSLGHSYGDELLQAVAERFSQAVGASGRVSRLGGDEFVIVSSQPDSFESDLKKLILEAAEPIDLGGKISRVTFSVGLAIYPYDGQSAAELFSNADMAMYRAKASGKNAVCIYSSEFARELRLKIEKTDQLRSALENDEFILHYQPQYSTITGAMVGVEALVRWQHPVEGLLYPADFISLAEETGFIVALGQLVLEKACRQAASWNSQGVTPLRMGVNVSARQFEDPNLLQSVKQALARADLVPDLLEIEITESMIMRDGENSIATLKELASLGVSIALDDFGTGYSSLSVLKRLPVKRLKIDRSFITDTPLDQDSVAITSAIVSLGSQLGMEIIAEGVESEEQASFLKSIGCNEAQGYYYGRPIPAEHFCTANAR
ncbi:EAL domain-containing protein [Neorhizobium sp. BT27B]|uniref:putative bifunctional diguanylate cyclase/phosphodiesterase n=1 Tax=Neorhizobium sp. BT27B TaxID=3142625 RepID=UPI003D26CF9A